MKKQIECANLSMTAIYSYSLALTLQEKKGFNSEFSDLRSSGLFEKLWIEVNSPKSKEIPNRETFPTMMNSASVKNTRDLSSGSKRYKDGEFYRIPLKRFAERANFYMIEYPPDDFVTTAGYLISSDGQVLKDTTRDTGEITGPANETLFIRINKVEVEQAIKDANWAKLFELGVVTKDS